jgi:peptidoglycan/LPS O-acetylase OafA/YrhL
LHSEVAAYGIFVSALILVHLHGRPATKLPFWLFVLLLGVGLAAHWWSISLFWRNYAGITALALAVNLLDRAPAALQSLLSFAPLRKIGLWSFSIYIWQQPFYLYLPHGALYGALGMVGALLFGVTSFYLIEQPARRYLNAHWGQGAVRRDLAPTGVS